MLNVNPCGFGGISTELRGRGLLLIPCYGPALSQTGRCDPQTSGAQIQKAIDSAVNMAALRARWPACTAWAKAQLLLNSSGIEDYCRKAFGGAERGIGLLKNPPFGHFPGIASPALGLGCLPRGKSFGARAAAGRTFFGMAGRACWRF